MERLWNAGWLACCMSVERPFASYIVRVLVRWGERFIQVTDLRRGTITELSDWAELARHLELAESLESADEPPDGRNWR